MNDKTKHQFVDALQQRNADMWLLDRLGNRILFASVFGEDEARWLWRTIAGVSAGQYLSGFQVTYDGEMVYEGNYVTDEC